MKKLTNIAGQELSTKVVRIKPLGAQVIIQPAPKREKTDSGIHIGTMEQDLNYGLIVGVGPGDEFNPAAIMATVKKGDTVMYDQESGYDLIVNKTLYKTMRLSDLKCILEEVDAEVAKKEAMPADAKLVLPDQPAISNAVGKAHKMPTPQQK